MENFCYLRNLKSLAVGFKRKQNCELLNVVHKYQLQYSLPIIKKDLKIHTLAKKSVNYKL